MNHAMGITVHRLVDTPHLRTRFHAGRSGGDQVINWAHTCELHEPWDWLEPFDLLMTNGLGIPETPDDQVNYVERLADAGMSGVTIGEGVDAPRLSDAMAEAAQRRALPILRTAYEVPFAAVARVVAESKMNVEERTCLIRTARVYDCVRMAAVEGSTAGLNTPSSCGSHYAPWRLSPSRRCSVVAGAAIVANDAGGGGGRRLGRRRAIAGLG